MVPGAGLHIDPFGLEQRVVRVLQHQRVVSNELGRLACPSHGGGPQSPGYIVSIAVLRNLMGNA